MTLGAALLALFILLRGVDSSLLKFLQHAGSVTHDSGGPVVISFCNVFFFSSLVSGLAMMLIDRRGLKESLPRLRSRDRWLLVMQSFSGYFLGPVALFLSLARLSVVEHTLLFSLTLPCTALAAHLVLREALPRLFAMCAGLIILGLVISVAGANQVSSAGFIDLIGVIWALVGVLAYSVSTVLNRMIALRRWGIGLCVGVSSVAAAVAFAVIALSLYGPSHFLYLRMWWVLGVIGGYALTITLGSQWSLMLAYAKLGVVPVTFWSSLTIVVAIAAAHALLGEPLFVNTIVGACLIIVAIGIYQKLCQGGTGNRPESTHLA